MRDCDFSYVGKVPTQLQRRLVFCTKAVQVNEALRESGVVGIITSRDLADFVPPSLGLAISQNPVGASLALQAHLCGLHDFQWSAFESKIHPTAVVHEGACVAARDVVIGAGSVVYPGAIVLPRTIIGKKCSIGAGTVVGTDAFEIDVSVDPYIVVKQSGGVRIGNYVDIQAKCTVVRSTFGGFTEIGDGSKFDCQVHLAHDCKTGRNVRIAACAEISGRVSIGDRAVIGPNVSVSNGLRIGNDSKITIGAVVTRDVPDGETVTGHFAVLHRRWLSFMRTLK